MLHPVVLSGGSGTRLWPLSRQDRPKQFLALMGERSLYQETVLRALGLPGVQAPITVCSDAHRFTVGEQLQAIGVGSGGIVLEPVARPGFSTNRSIRNPSSPNGSPRRI